MRSIAAALLTVAASLSAAGQQTPVAEFEERIAAYMKLRAEAQQSAAGNERGVAATDQNKILAEAIRARRPEAARGEIFTEAVSREFRRLIADSFRHNPKSIRTSIRSGEPVAPAAQINRPYPAGVPVQTMPPSLLAALPQLPQPLTYRIAGDSLLLLDAGDQLTLDYIPHALPRR